MKGERPWLAGDAAADGGKRHAPATLRNRDAIAEVLRAELPPSGRVLEVASGSGEHIVHFARLFPQLCWQPSDPDPAALASIAAWRAERGLGNIAFPVALDAMGRDWPDGPFDAILCINMVHISPWEATGGLFAMAAGGLLARGGLLYLYGPYIRSGVPTAPSNLAFDQSLRARDPRWGLREVAAMEALGKGERLALDRLVEMPANNLSLIFRSHGAPGNTAD